ncbi:MAG: hypothetical protein KIS29_10510 [Thermoplasmata archaeon]|nr:hypothetical protein [Candidatus Sysuiplasma jiujiangense]
MIFKYPKIRRRTYWLIALGILLLNIENTPSTFFNPIPSFSVMGFLVDLLLAEIGYIGLKFLIVNFTESGK